MSYNSSIPNAGDFLSLSQKQILSNFQSINNSFFEDHVALTAVEDVGKHNYLTFTAQIGDPATAADQCALYNKIVSSVPQLFFRPSNNGTPIQLTNSNLNTIQTGGPTNTQSSFLAGPFTIYFGYVVNCPISQLMTMPGSSTLIYVGLSTIKTNSTPNNNQGSNTAVATDITGNQFTIRRAAVSLVNPTVYYTAIGI